MRPFHHLLSQCHLPSLLLLMILDWPSRRLRLRDLSPGWDRSDCRMEVWLGMIEMVYRRLTCPPSSVCQILSTIVGLVVPRSTWDYTAQSWEHTRYMMHSWWPSSPCHLAGQVRDGLLQSSLRDSAHGRMCGSWVPELVRFQCRYWCIQTRVGGHQTEAKWVYFFLCHSLEGKGGWYDRSA